MCINPLKIMVNGEEKTVKCGKCIICQRQKQSEWAIKLINENKYHKKSCFITLTFDNRILLDKNSKANKYGANASFVYHIDNSAEYFVKFIKRLRKKFANTNISYFHVAEYGEKNKRPHHHVILYGINFEHDRIEMEKSKTGKTQYFSKTLNDLWACGKISIQDLNNKNTAYISQYSLKKFKNNKHNKRYKPKMTFSSRNKMNIRWARRNKTEILKGFLEDEEHKKYKIPKSYIDNFKNSEQQRYKEIYRNYEDIIQNNIIKYNDKERLEREKIKAEILTIRAEKTTRDF